jgi:lipopolysaccharide transport system permease protein
MRKSSTTSETTLIAPPTVWEGINLRELWRYRELLLTFAERDIKIRYKQSLLGFAWVALPPIFTMVIFNFLFGALLGNTGKPTIPGVPYAISTFCALLPWQFFANSFSKSSSSLVSNRALITKIYFPRLIAPIAPVIAASLDFLITLSVLCLIIAGYQVLTDYTFLPHWSLIFIPFFFTMTFFSALSFSLWFSSLNAIYRDFQLVIPFFIQFLFFLSPVIYTPQALLAKMPWWLSAVYFLNPMAGVIEGFRWALLGVGNPPLLSILSSFLVTILLLVSGTYFFRRIEHKIADIV